MLGEHIHDRGTPAAASVAGQQTQIFHISTGTRATTTVDIFLTDTFPRITIRGDGIAGIASVEEGSRVRGEWVTELRLNGDQSNQGRSVSLPAHGFKLLRVKLYAIPRP